MSDCNKVRMSHSQVKLVHLVSNVNSEVQQLVSYAWIVWRVIILLTHPYKRAIFAIIFYLDLFLVLWWFLGLVIISSCSEENYINCEAKKLGDPIIFLVSYFLRTLGSNDDNSLFETIKRSTGWFLEDFRVGPKRSRGTKSSFERLSCLSIVFIF